MIKPSDKSGGVVVMDTKQYEKACLDLLQDKEFYEEVEEDPTPRYRVQFDERADRFRVLNLISDAEEAAMRKGNRTPCFYGLPKTHKHFETFPDLRPICSGSDSPSVKTSEFVDGFLKPAATKTASYVRDTTSFINKTRNISLPTSPDQDIWLCTLDVKSLYTNIHHDDGVEACKSFLDKRNNKRFPTDSLCELIRSVLQSNTMQFGSRYFHQIKGTAMGTPMAVNYANLFMSSFEQRLLESFEKDFHQKPYLWLRFIDDIFFVWVGSEETLQAFIEYANNFSKKCGMRSNIEFTDVYSKTSVNFLDMVVKIGNSSLVTDLYTKVTAAHDYVQRSSYHPQHCLRAIPKGQFIRLRRICTHVSDYSKHAESFITFFRRRGYQETELRKVANSIQSTPREDFLTPKKRKEETVLTLVLTYHHKMNDFSKILRNCYDTMTTKYPELKHLFPSSPIVSTSFLRLQLHPQMRLTAVLSSPL